MSSHASSSSGLISIHAVPRPLLVRLEWSISRLIGASEGFSWRPMPGHTIKTLAAGFEPAVADLSSDFQIDAATESMVCAEIRFDCTHLNAAEVASELAKWQSIWFEVSTPCSVIELGQRYCFTPLLGMFHGQLDQAGNQVFNENQLLTLLSPKATGDFAIRAAMNVMLGVQWDAQLEPLRKANLEARYRTELAS